MDTVPWIPQRLLVGHFVTVWERECCWRFVWGTVISFILIIFLLFRVIENCPYPPFFLSRLDIRLSLIKYFLVSVHIFIVYCTGAVLAESTIFVLLIPRTCIIHTLLYQSSSTVYPCSPARHHSYAQHFFLPQPMIQTLFNFGEVCTYTWLMCRSK